MQIGSHLRSIKIPRQKISKCGSKIVKLMSENGSPWDDYRVMKSEGEYIE